MSPKTILIVDDEVELCRTLESVLTPRGYRVALAHRGADGLAAAKTHKPDLIILDLQMPDMDGWHVCQRLKKDAALAHIPVIMLSALVDDKQEKGPLEVGDAYVSKPFEMKVLLGKIRALLGEAELSGEEAAKEEA